MSLEVSLVEEEGFARFEKELNPFDRIPGLGTLSGFLRFLVGKVQVVAGVLLTPFNFLWALFTLTPSAFFQGQGILYIAHGIGNMIRASIAALPVINFFVLVPYDFVVGRMRYPWETKKPAVYIHAVAG